MNLFYLSLILSFLSLIILKNKKTALGITFLLMIIPWCFQYEMTQDWNVNSLRWDYVNVNSKVGLDGEGRELEPLYEFILKICKPLSFFGFLIVSGLVELLVIFMFIRKYVQPSFYWVSIFILMIKVNFGLLLINSNRQTLSVIAILLAVWLLLKWEKPNNIFEKSNVYLLLSFILFFSAPKIHSSAFISLILIPVYFLIIYFKKPNRILLFIIFNILYVSRFVIDVEKYQFFASIYLDSLEIEGIDFFDKYLNGLDNSDLVSSRFNQLTEWLMMNLIIYFLPKMKNEYRLFGISWIISYIWGGFLIQTLARITIYFYVFLIIIAPKIFELLNEKYNKTNVFLLSSYILLVSFTLNTFYENMKDNGEGRYYYRWDEFKTIFEAPEWR